MAARQLLLAGAAALVLTACNNSGKSAAPGSTGTATPAPTPTPTPPPTPTPTAISYYVLPCLYQTVPGTGGIAVSGLVLPDTLTINLAAPSGFPNGRRLEDQVIDLTLAVLFLDLTKTGVRTLADIPLDPGRNDQPFRSEFPYFAPPNSVPEPQSQGGSAFDFRTDPDTAYTRVDRMGMPAVATALIPSSRKVAFNDADPADDARGDYVADIVDDLEVLTNALADDFIARGLPICARRK